MILKGRGSDHLCRSDKNGKRSATRFARLSDDRRGRGMAMYDTLLLLCSTLLYCCRSEAVDLFIMLLF